MTAAELISLLSKAPDATMVFIEGVGDALWPLPLEMRHIALNNEANAWVLDLGVEKPTET
jgi:hypothetical protein